MTNVWSIAPCLTILGLLFTYHFIHLVFFTASALYIWTISIKSSLHLEAFILYFNMKVKIIFTFPFSLDLVFASFLCLLFSVLCLLLRIDINGLKKTSTQMQKETQRAMKGHWYLIFLLEKTVRRPYLTMLRWRVQTDKNNFLTYLVFLSVLSVSEPPTGNHGARNHLPRNPYSRIMLSFVIPFNTKSILITRTGNSSQR